ncbi:MAG: MFS transporter, partial [Bacteroidales bacterium]|nr:MFS transporter [Bacteroidales bacterium]
IISVVLYAIGSGLIEVLVSPIVEACPFENKESVMSLLHSFYCWGSLGVVLISSLFFTVFGIENWRWIARIWALIPIYNIYNFMTCPIEHLVEDGEGLGIRKLFSVPLFWVSVILMVCAGASELSMAQWASAYVESALGLSKAVGDMAGPCLFALAMGICRVFYGKFGEQLDLYKYMLVSGALCVVCYLMAALSRSPAVGLIGCVLCGAAVGIMWPGTISISAATIPKGGTAMFALLAMAGDLGGTIGPALVGKIAQTNGDDVQRGLLFGMIFPIVLIFSIKVLIVCKKKDSSLNTIK